MMTLTNRKQDGTADGAYARMTQAWQWLCAQRAAAPEGADVWDIRWQHLEAGPTYLADLTSRLLRGEYRLAPLQLQGRQTERKAVWGAQDALVLKWVALSIQHLLPLHPACEHVKGHGGGKRSVTTLNALLTEKKTDGRAYPWVCRADIRGYYRHINKATLMQQVRQHVACPVLRDLVHQYIHYTVEDGGTFHTPQTGISRGCPLSPLMGALHLYDMDAHFSRQKHIHYARYMDDIIILAKSRWQLRKHTRQLKQWFSEYGFEAHPDKTFIGRTDRGFDWMGAWLTHEGVTDIAPRAKANHREKVRRLYERLARVPLWARKREAQRVHAKVSTYRKRWTIWAGALLAVSTCAMADGPVVVLASGNVAGDTGARFSLSTTMHVTLAGADNGGVCVSANYRGCSSLNLYEATLTPMGWGLVPRSYWQPANLVLVPQGHMHLEITGGDTAAAGDVVRDLDLGNGEAVTQDGRHYVACRPQEGNSDTRVFTYTASIHSRCPFETSTAIPSLTGALTYSGTIAIYAKGPLSPGGGTLPTLFAGVKTDDYPYVRLAKPNAVIISGLNCSLSAAGPVEFPLGAVSLAPTAGTAAAEAEVGLTVTCAGTNSTDEYAGSVQNSIEFDAGPGMTADGFKLTADNQPGFYGTIGRVGGENGCDKALTLGQPDPDAIQVYHAGEQGKTTPVSYIFNLCRTGKSQTPGDYTMRLTATLVNI